MSGELKDLLERVHSPGAMRDWRHESKLDQGESWDRDAMTSLGLALDAFAKKHKGAKDNRVKNAVAVVEALAGTLAFDYHPYGSYDATPKYIQRSVAKFLASMAGKAEAREFRDDELAEEKNQTSQDAHSRVAHAQMGSLVDPSDKFLRALREKLYAWISDIDEERIKLSRAAKKR